MWASGVESGQHVAARLDSPGVVVMPPAVLLSCLILGAVLEWFLPPEGLGAPLSVSLAGAVLAVAGFAFMMWGHGRFKALDVSVVTVRPASQLVTGGAYRRSRNPMYTGMIATYAGVAMCVAGVWLCATLILFFLYLSLYVIPREEAYLVRRFGSEYADYCKRVRRWL